MKRCFTQKLCEMQLYEERNVLFISFVRYHHICIPTKFDPDSFVFIILLLSFFDPRKPKKLNQFPCAKRVTEGKE